MKSRTNNNTASFFSSQVDRLKAEHALCVMAYHIDGWHKKINDPATSLHLDEILQVTANSFRVSADELTGKITTKTRDKQLCLLGVACVYNDRGDREIAKYLGRQGQLSWTGKYFVRNVAWHKYQPEHQALLQIIATCEKLSGGRLKRNVKVKLGIGNIRVVPEPSFNLTPYQIARIKVQKLDWFYEDKKVKNIIAYHVECGEPRLVQSVNVYQGEHLWSLQDLGFRFIYQDSNIHKHYKAFHPVCDRCIKKMDCRLRGEGLLSIDDPFKCFEGTESLGQGVDASLLKPYEKYQLQ